MKASERGFSMVEPLAAMTATVIVIGAVSALLASGGSAFRREPALADHQRSIRMSLAAIQNDVRITGTRLPDFGQAFTLGLDGVGPAAPAGGTSDFLELYGDDGLCPVLDVCKGDTGSSLTTWQGIPDCFHLPGLVILSDGVNAVIQWAELPGTGSGGSCSGGGANGGGNGHVVFPHGGAPEFNPSGGAPFTPTTMATIQAIRYEIRPDPQDGTPALWRSPFGGVAPPSNSGGGAGWQLLGRGIEDLQVRYRDGSGWHDSPRAVVSGDYGTIVQEVRVTLGGRATGRALQGQLRPATTAAPAVRGGLTTTASPRAALFVLGKGHLWP
jgi:hypothetical protein